MPVGLRRSQRTLTKQQGHRRAPELLFIGSRSYTGESVIVMGSEESEVKRAFASVRKVADVSHPYFMPYRHFDVYYCQGLEKSLIQLWPTVKDWN